MKATYRIYELNKVITFSSTKGKFGSLSNMAPGYSLFVNEININNSEALYQSCRFALFPDIQERIINEKSPMNAKKISRKYNKYTRQDWSFIKFDVMRWCLKIKLIQNKTAFSDLLRLTKDKPLVEYSTKDKEWAATPKKKELLEGKNALGRLLMELREKYIINNENLEFVSPLNIPSFHLFGKQIEKVFPTEYSISDFNITENDELK